MVFRDSPIKRIGRDRFVRNVLIAIGNSGDTQLTVHVRGCLGDSSPLVRAMAVWALSRLVSEREFKAMCEQYARAETDPVVSAEWLACVELSYPH